MGAFWRRRYLLGTLVCDLKLHASSAAYPTGLFVVEKTPILYYPVSCVVIWVPPEMRLDNFAPEVEMRPFIIKR